MSPFPSLVSVINEAVDTVFSSATDEELSEFFSPSV